MEGSVRKLLAVAITEIKTAGDDLQELDQIVSGTSEERES